jgi:hypothetical protein
MIVRFLSSSYQTRNPHLGIARDLLGSLLGNLVSADDDSAGAARGPLTEAAMADATSGLSSISANSMANSVEPIFSGNILRIMEQEQIQGHCTASVHTA